MFTVYCQHCKSPIIVKKYPANNQVNCLVCYQIHKLESEKKYYPRIVMLQGEQRGQEFIVEDPTTLGRGTTNTIHLSERKASRRHAMIYCSNGQYMIEDLQSGNGTFVNDHLITKTDLNDKDSIRIADAVFMFRNLYHYTPEVESSPNIAANIENLLNTPNEALTKGTSPDSVNTCMRRNFVPQEPYIPQQAVLTEGKSDFQRTRAELKFDAQHSFLMSVEELRNITEIEKANNKLRIIYKVNGAISSTLNLQELLTIILDEVFQYIPAERGAILLYDKEAKELRSSVIKIRNQDESDEEGLKISKTILDRVVEEQVSLLTTDALVDERLAESMSIISQGIRSAMSVPLISKKDLLGVLHIDSTKKSEEFNQDNLELLTGIAGQAAIAIENAKLIQEIQREVETRGHLQRYLSPELVEQVVKKQITLEIGGELKKAAILFSDLRGFTKMTENVGAEAVVAILNDYFSRMVDIIFATGGTLDKFIGDAIMAIWGLPIGHVEDSLRSVKASLLMQREMFYFNIYQRAIGRSLLKMGIGINTGSVVVGNMGSPKRMEYTVIGPPVNLASRVETLTSRNQILISDNIFAEVKNVLRYVELTPTKVKGIDRLIQIYGIVGLYDIHENREIMFLPIVIPTKFDSEKKWEGLIEFFDAKQVILNIEPNPDIQISNTYSFNIDIPDIAPNQPVKFLCKKCETKKHNQDEFFQVEGEIVEAPDEVLNFFLRVFPQQNFEITITT